VAETTTAPAPAPGQERQRASGDGAAELPVGVVGSLQAGIGNRAVARLVQREPPGPTPPTSAAPPTPDEVRFFESPIENLVGTIGKKKSIKSQLKWPMNRKVWNDWVVLEGFSITAEAGLEIARAGNTTVLSLQEGAAQSATREQRKSELEGRGRTVGAELKTTHDGLITQIRGKTGAIQGEALEVKWLGIEGLVGRDDKGNERFDEVGLGAEITEKVEIPLFDKMKFTPSVSLSLGLVGADMKSSPPSVKVGAVSLNAAGEAAHKDSLPPLDLAGLRTPRYDKAWTVKVTGSGTARLNEAKIAQKLAIIVAEQVAKKALPAVVRSLKILDGPPAKMIAIGVMTVCNGIDAFIEGNRQKNLGELAASLPYVFAGGFMSTYQKMAVSAPATAYGPVAQFQEAGAGTGTKARAAVVDEVKKHPDATGRTDAEIATEIDAAIKEKPLGMAQIAADARKQVDDYVLKKFIDTRTNAATDIFDFLAGTDHKIDPNNPESSPEYVHFRDKVLKAYTTRTNDPYFQDTALKNAMERARQEGVQPDQLEAWIANYMQKQAQGAIDAAEPDTRGDELEGKKKAINDLLSGYVSDEDIRNVQPIVLGTPKDKGRDDLIAVCRNWKLQLNERQAKLLSDLTGC